MRIKKCCVHLKKDKQKRKKLTFTRFYNATTFICELAVLQACSRGVRAFPFGAAAGACGFVFVTPDFEFAATDMAVNVSGFGLE
jgi:hypothetical protein